MSPETMRRIAAWRDAASIRSGLLFRRVGVICTKGHPGRRALGIFANVKLEDRMVVVEENSAERAEILKGLRHRAVRTIIAVAFWTRPSRAGRNFPCSYEPCGPLSGEAHTRRDTCHHHAFRRVYVSSRRSVIMGR